MALKAYNNLKAEKEWDVEGKKDAGDAKFLSLTAQLEDLKKSKIVDERVNDDDLDKFLTQKINLFEIRGKFFKLDANVLKNCRIGEQYSKEALEFLCEVISSGLKVNHIKTALEELSIETKMCEQNPSTGKLKVRWFILIHLN